MQCAPQNIATATDLNDGAATAALRIYEHIRLAYSASLPGKPVHKGGNKRDENCHCKRPRRFELKEFIKEHLSAKTPESAKNLEIIDLGTDSEESVDYPLYGKLCGETVASGKADLGIVLCGTGIGISIAANKVRGIRCGLCTSVEMARLTKQHNNANILALGGRTTKPELAAQIVDAWLDAEFEGGRHQRRVDMLDNM